jgi:hypothetical protein
VELNEDMSGCSSEYTSTTMGLITNTERSAKVYILIRILISIPENKVRIFDRMADLSMKWKR